MGILEYKFPYEVPSVRICGLRIKIIITEGMKQWWMQLCGSRDGDLVKF